jgi:hypothetical protein
MSRFRQDPGPCIICGAPHCSCGGGPIEVVQLPLRDAAIAAAVATSTSDSQAVSTPAPDDTRPSSRDLGDGSDDRPFSTATYRSKGKRRR